MAFNKTSNMYEGYIYCITNKIKVLVNNCVGDFVWRFMQSLESLYL